MSNIILIAHNIRSLHNVGSIFRSADVFGIKKIYLTGYTGQPPRKEIAKVALGSEHRVDWEYKENIFDLVDELKKSNISIFGLETGGESIESVNTTEPIALIVGNEVEGIEKTVLDVCDQIIEIPMIGKKQSLNVSVATGIALFALSGKSGKM